MTEDQAKTKACCGPYIAAAAIATAQIAHDGGNRPTSLNGYCIASACMAWRWEKEPNADWRPANHQMAVWPPSNPYAGDPSFVLSKTNGRCGLAGQQ